MATKKITAPNFDLSSSWKCRFQYHGTQNYGYYTFESGPTTTSRKVSFAYSIPSGAKIKKARICVTFQNASTGYSILSVNGSSLKRQEGTKYYVDISLPGTSGTYNATFSFKANGSKEDSKPHTVWASFKDVRLEIEHDGDEKTYTPPKVTTATGGKTSLSIPPQSCCVYDPSNGNVYMFDGVIKIQHQFSLNIEEEPSNKKEQFVNNARNEPDKVTLDVIMSDVYTGGGAIEGTPSLSSAQSSALSAARKKITVVENSRSANALGILKALKEARKKLAVITPQYVHVDMLISSIVCNQEEAAPYSWTGQIIFQHAYAAKPKTVQNGGAKQGGDVKPTPSFGVLIGQLLTGKK